MFKVIIIGCGSIGFRHFEGLMKTDLPLNIHVIDPNAKALERVKKYYEKFNAQENTKKKFCYLSKSIQNTPDEIDLCIIATCSKVRLTITESLLKVSNVKYLILEKVLFQKESDYERMSSLLAQYDVKGCWVNCPLRSISVFKELKEKIKTNNLIYHVEYNDFGIGCNSIHQLDVFSFLTNCLNLKIDTSELKSIIKSKRKGYLEVLGTLKAYTDKGDELVVSCTDQSSPVYFIKLIFNDEIWTIYPLIGKLTVEKKQNNEIKEKTFIYPKQSDITPIVAADLLQLGKCPFPDYETSKKLHLLLIRDLNTFFTKVLDYEVIECPIT